MENKIKVSQAIVVEGRDDIDAVSRAVDALLIPTHGFGITAETWNVIEKAYNEKGLIILTDPDHAGETIRQKLTEKFPEAIQCFMTQEDATKADDIGIENAKPEMIAKAIIRALELSEKSIGHGNSEYGEKNIPEMNDLIRLGLAGTESAAQLRKSVCRELGIGYGNAKAMLTKLKGFGIEIDELEETILRIKEK